MGEVVVVSSGAAHEGYESVQELVESNVTQQELHKLFQLCTAQQSSIALVGVLERNCATLVDADAVRVLLLSASTGKLTHGRDLLEPVGLTGQAMRSGELIGSDNASRDSRFVKEVDEIPGEGAPHAALYLPIVADSRVDCRGDKEVVAVLQAARVRNDRAFSARDTRLLKRVADFVGNLLKNSRMWDRAHAQYHMSVTSAKRSAALLEVAKALASETKLERLVSIIVSQVPELLDCDRCTMFFVDSDKRELIVKKGASKGRAKSLVSWVFGQCNAPELPFDEVTNEIRFPITTGIAGAVATTGETINLPDAHMDPRFNPAMDKETGYRTRSMLCVPMIDSAGVIIGVVQAINKNPMYPQFDDEDVMLLRTFSAQAALAVRNCQLLDRTQRALQKSDALLEVTIALNKELKIDALLNVIVVKVQELLDTDRCTVFVLDTEKKMLYTSDRMSHGMGPSLPIDQKLSTMICFPMDRGIAGAVATSGRTLNIEDAYKDDRFNRAMDLKTGYRTKSILCMAIRNHRDQIVGVLQVMNKRVGRFNKDDENMLHAFTCQAAVAIENNLLFQKTEAALNQALSDQRNLKFLLSVTKNLFSDLHLTSMIDQITTQVHHLLKADDCTLYLVDQKKKSYGLAKEIHEAGCKRYPFNVGIVGEVARTGATVRISQHAFKHPLFHPEVDQRKDKITQSLLCCPIKAETGPDTEQVIGVISVRDEQDRGGFEQEEEKLLKVFSAQAAVAIQNARRFSSITDETEFSSKADMSAAQYLKETRGMKLATHDIESFQFRMEEIHLKGSIGNGSYGEVYRAVVRNQLVAVKKLHVKSLKAEQIDAFCKEASLMCQLIHPNVVGFIGAVTEPHNLCIITEFCSRGSMADLLLDDSISMDFPRKVKFALHAARGMAYLHGSNPVILHRDLKSDNLLVSDDWNVKVADFGLTRFLTEKKIMTQVGTPMWMAPEIIMGKKYTEKADVYAFGIILWEILTRAEPYEDKEPMQIVVEVVNQGLRPTIPAAYLGNPFVPLMQDCWQADPDKRPSFPVIVERLATFEKDPNLKLYKSG